MNFRLLSNYTFQDTEILKEPHSDPLLAPGRELRCRPRHQASVTAEASFARATFAATP